jgi:hypothetical protein
VDSTGSKHIRLSIHNCPLPRLVPYNRLMPIYNLTFRHHLQRR